jgi:hypothetical protein
MAVATAARFCGRCGAQLAPGATFCGRCGAPAGAPVVAAAQPVYSYPAAPRVVYQTRRQTTMSQVAIAVGLLIVLAIVTVAITAFAVSRFTRTPSRPTCTTNCAPKIVTPLPEGATYHSSAFGYTLNYSSRWKVHNEDANGIAVATNLGSLQVAGMRAGDNGQVLQATVNALPSGTWQGVTLVANLKGAHIGDQDGLGAVYSANLIGANATSTAVRFAVIVATKGDVTIVMFAVDPADPKNSPNGMPEGQLFDYVCTEFVWPS